MNDERIIEKFNKEINEWEEIPFFNLKEGDIFRIFVDKKRFIDRNDGNNVWIAKSDSFINKDCIWEIYTLY